MIDSAAFQTLAAHLGCPLPPEQATRLLAYLDAMLAENEHINLTAVRERKSAVVFHALDSLALGLKRLKVAPKRALDLGTGNGFPGVAIACLYPKAHVVLMDRTLKKLKAIARALDIAGFDPAQFTTVQMDAAEAPAHWHRAMYDLICTRAVGPPTEVGALAKPLLHKEGRFLAWLSDDTPAPTTLKGGLRRLALVDYHLPAPANRERRLAHYGF